MNIHYFEDDNNKKTKSKAYIDAKLKSLFKIEPAKDFAVILHNDPINGVDFVVKVIDSIFDYGKRQSILLMLKAHFTGKSILWIGTYAKALEKQNQIQSFGGDPNMQHRGAQPLHISIELQA